MVSYNKYLRIRILLIILLIPAITLAQSPSIKYVTYNQFDSLISRAKGSVSFVCIYSATCPACNKQMPIVNYIGQVYGRKGLTMIVGRLLRRTSRLSKR